MLNQSWSLILGVSSGFGRATAREMARRGANVIGVHFDTADGAEEAQKLAEEIRDTGVQAHFFNLNAASASTRVEVVARTGELTGDRGVRVLLHSLAFGTLLPFVATPQSPEVVTARQMAMTVDVMAHSLVYWVQDLHAAGLLPRGAKVFSMTSAGSSHALGSYGPVSAAKAALEAHTRQLAVELAPQGVAVNALRAGTTLTPALQKIPGSAAYADACRARNPHRRLTEPEDVAEMIGLFAGTDSSWMTGNVIGVDGGELISA
ncbi:SDR family oxidoreductase [Mangrovihabitans endophyticus]|uniref:Short-chain dehydrogenase n=1 Tax=Mangrovihabitans endophyticus TaxID=1751298 RepID=A0A8J3FMH1_9ACTN|nr:SDR family oxidoreductase [Mangrovihabitans endophyticus]GGK75956.1 short-chain dehydrogenase [Mangrovihabitans endophyticus]